MFSLYLSHGLPLAVVSGIWINIMTMWIGGFLFRWPAYVLSMMLHCTCQMMPQLLTCQWLNSSATVEGPLGLNYTFAYRTLKKSAMHKISHFLHASSHSPMHLILPLVIFYTFALISILSVLLATDSLGQHGGTFVRHDAHVSVFFSF